MSELNETRAAMSGVGVTAPVRVASVSDRGLSEKRPLNEDSFLVDVERRIFVVADGVGGAQAGEVASRKAVEVLDEAFRHQAVVGGDVEDLMELAIQRANASIHRMSRENSKLNTMATTIVALYLDGFTATIGHVGDSRLYRLTPDGELLRETDDHSMVEEEVRAGRMTPDQAVNHPSRNIISRALGAEASVEVDLKTVVVEAGTIFLLCSDGITRHLSDDELRALLVRGGDDLDAVCAEMKRLCYERGAEDNLTAVILRIGEVEPRARQHSFDDERTIAAPRAATANSTTVLRSAVSSDDGSYGNSALMPESSQVTTPSNATFPNANAPTPPKPISRQVISLDDINANASPQEAPTRRDKSSNLARTLALTSLVVIAAAAAAFYGGTIYRQRHNDRAQQATPVATQTINTMTPIASGTEIQFEQLRREVDRAPQATMNRMARENGGKPLDSSDPEFLYLYGRALMLSGKHDEAAEAFKRTLDKLGQRAAPQGRDPLKIEARISAAAVALKSHNPEAQQTAAKDLDDIIQLENSGTDATNTDASQR